MTDSWRQQVDDVFMGRVMPLPDGRMPPPPPATEVLRTQVADHLDAQAQFNRGQVARNSGQDVLNRVVGDELGHVGYIATDARRRVTWQPNRTRLMGWTVLGLLLGAIVGFVLVFVLDLHFNVIFDKGTKWSDVKDEAFGFRVYTTGLLALLGAVLGHGFGKRHMRRAFNRQQLSYLSPSQVMARQVPPGPSWNAQPFPRATGVVAPTQQPGSSDN